MVIFVINVCVFIHTEGVGSNISTMVKDLVQESIAVWLIIVIILGSICGFITENCWASSHYCNESKMKRGSFHKGTYVCIIEQLVYVHMLQRTSHVVDTCMYVAMYVRMYVKCVCMVSPHI